MTPFIHSLFPMTVFFLYYFCFSSSVSSNIVFVYLCGASLSIIFSLTHPAGATEPPVRNPEQMGSVRLDTRQLLRVLSSHALMPSNVVACVFDSRALVLHVFAETLYVMYEIPHVQGWTILKKSITAIHIFPCIDYPSLVLNSLYTLPSFLRIFFLCFLL